MLIKKQLAHSHGFPSNEGSKFTLPEQGSAYIIFKIILLFHLNPPLFYFFSEP